MAMLKRYLHSCVHCSVIHSSLNMRWLQIFTDTKQSWVHAKQSPVHPLKTRAPAICNNMGGGIMLNEISKCRKIKLHGLTYV